MDICQAKIWTRTELEQPCTKTVEEGKVFCRWHDPQDESWREIFKRLAEATPEEKTDIVLELIEEHPEHKLVLPERDGEKANLYQIDLSKEALDNRKKQSGVDHPHWWSALRIGSAHLRGANLQGANLRGAKLGGADLDYANLENADLTAANLQGAFLMVTKLQRASLFSSNLENARLGSADLTRAFLDRAYCRSADLSRAHLQTALMTEADLTDADLSEANLQNASLLQTKLYNTNLRHADLRGANLLYAFLERTDLRSAKLQGVDLSIAGKISYIFISEAWLDRTRLHREQLGDAIGEELLSDYAAAKRGYLALKQNFDDLGDYEAASWAYRKERRMEKLEAWQRGDFFKFLSDTFIEWLCDYGESVWRVVGWMATLLFVLGPLLFSGLGGIEWGEELTREYFALPSSFHRLSFWYYHYLLYTLDTLTTASFSGLQPMSDAVKRASGFFAIAGIVLAGLLGFVAGNRIRRS